MVQAPWKTARHFLIKSSIHLLFKPESPLLVKAYIPTKTCPQMFIGALFIIVKNWKPPKCPSTAE